ncbi:GNAT family N-acetyltransferase [Streptomyces rimosus]|uniref:GNAT family N-acetyltransferase n=1 Tax=Streptomyces rimosus TaxID=1927 RepID=UPI0004C8A325|nr:GNAT family N-acetyltransferase [Streptomyces rimosus]
MDITIRPARQEEFEEIGELLVAAYAADGLLVLGLDDPYVHELRKVAERAEHAEVLAAVDADGTVLGAVTFAAPGSPYAEIAGPDEGEFRMLAVAPAGRGRGIGEALVRACMDRARSLGLTRMVLSALPHIENAHRVYERIGFTRIPERDWEPVPDITLLAFTCDLGVVV